MLGILADAKLYLDEALNELSADLSEYNKDELIAVMDTVEGKIEAAIECLKDYERD